MCDCYSVINPSSIVCVSITDPGMTLMHRDQIVRGLVATETYGPRVYIYHINLLLLSYLLCYLLCLYFTLHLYHKNTKNIILSDLTLVSDRVGIDNPLSRWLRGFICFV